MRTAALVSEGRGGQTFNLELSVIEDDGEKQRCICRSAVTIILYISEQSVLSAMTCVLLVKIIMSTF